MAVFDGGHDDIERREGLLPFEPMASASSGRVRRIARLRDNSFVPGKEGLLEGITHFRDASAAAARAHAESGGRLGQGSIQAGFSLKQWFVEEQSAVLE